MLSKEYHQQNALGPAVLAAACARRGAHLLTFSSGLVFDGAKAAPYVESDPVAPINAFGRCMAEAEARVLRALPTALVVRPGELFGPWDDATLVSAALHALAAGRTFAVADDLIISPAYVPHLVHTALDLLIDGERGIWHLANPGTITWADLARRAARLAGLDAGKVVGRPARELGLLAPRPAYSVLGSERGILLPTLDEALVGYAREDEPRWSDNRGDDRPDSEARSGDVWTSSRIA